MRGVVFGFNLIVFMCEDYNEDGEIILLLFIFFLEVELLLMWKSKFVFLEFFILSRLENLYLFDFLCFCLFGWRICFFVVWFLSTGGLEEGNNFLLVLFICDLKYKNKNKVKILYVNI